MSTIVIVVFILSSGCAVADFHPNDTYWSHPINEQWGPKHIDADDAWGMNDEFNALSNPGRRDIIVAVLDTGVDRSHTDLAASFWDDGAGHIGYDFAMKDPWVDVDGEGGTGHGTHIAGIIAGVINNNKGVAGMAQVRLMIGKMCGDGGGIPGDWYKVWTDALEWVRNNGADVINIASNIMVNDSNLRTEFKNALNASIVISMASGNWNQSLYDDGDGICELNECNNVTVYSDMERIICVGATDDQDLRCNFSFWGEHLDVMAPGHDIISTIPIDTYTNYSGTSMASAYVSGLAALILSYRPDLSNTEVKRIIEQTSNDIIDSSGHTGEGGLVEIPTEGRDDFTGWGLINAEKALRTTLDLKTDWSHRQEYGNVNIENGIYNTEDIDIDSRGYSHIVYIHEEATPQVYYRRVSPSGSITVNDMQISDGTRVCNNPSVFTDNEFNIHITWRKDLVDGTDDELYYVKYLSDMTIDINPMIIDQGPHADNNFKCPKVVVTVETNDPTAYVIYDKYDSTSLKDILFYSIDASGSGTGPSDFIATGSNEGYGEYCLDADISYTSSRNRIHVVWQEKTSDDFDIMYRSLYLTTPPSFSSTTPIANNPDVDEKYPDLDVEFRREFVHIVYENWRIEQSTSRDDQIIEYRVLDSTGTNFLVVEGDDAHGPLYLTEVGLYHDHGENQNGKILPSVAFSHNDVVTIVWREWEDDTPSGYYSLYSSQYYVCRELFYTGQDPYSIRLITDGREKILSNKINYLHGWFTNERARVASTDYRTPNNPQHYDTDSHIRILFHNDVSVNGFRLEFMTTREYWDNENNLGHPDGRECTDPDIDIDDGDGWHIAYTAFNVTGNPSWEIYYRNKYYHGNDMLVSNILLNGDDSINPRIVTRQFVDYEHHSQIYAYIFWIDFENSPTGELFFTIIDAKTMLFVGPMPNPGPTRVPFTQGWPYLGEDKHEISLDDEDDIIHVIYRVGVPDEYTGIRYEVHHGSINEIGLMEHGDNNIAGEVGWDYDNPSIDIGYDSRPYVVYTKKNFFQWDVYYDVLHEVTGSPDVMAATGREKVDDRDLMQRKADNPDIRVERQYSRNAVLAPAAAKQNLKVHIVWVEDCDDDGHWYLKYSKWHPVYKNGNPIITERTIQPYGYVIPTNPPDPELSITHDNELYMIYSSRTRGYKSDGAQPFNRVFFVKMDVNGVIQTTNTYISANSNTDVINSASDINSYDELMVVWDIFDPAGNGGLGQWSNTILWRTYQWNK